MIACADRINEFDNVGTSRVGSRSRHWRRAANGAFTSFLREKKLATCNCLLKKFIFECEPTTEHVDWLRQRAHRASWTIVTSMLPN